MTATETALHPETTPAEPLGLPLKIEVFRGRLHQINAIRKHPDLTGFRILSGLCWHKGQIPS
jgi:hypothetical protein